MVLTEHREDHVRYIRLCVLVIVKGREALEDFLQKRLQKQYGKARPFSEILDESQIKRTLSQLEILTDDHRNLLYPNNNAMIKDTAGEWLGRPNASITLKDLDINTLYVFLRYFSELMSPERNIWKNPWPGDNRPEACITRIRVYRNKLAFNKTRMINQREFDELWNDRVSDLGTLSHIYAPEYYKALASVQIVIYPNKKQIDGMLKIMNSMYDSVYEEIRDLEQELERLFESLSLSQAPKLVHIIDSIRKKERPRERPVKSIPKRSKWNKIKIATIEQLEGPAKIEPIVKPAPPISPKAVPSAPPSSVDTSTVTSTPVYEQVTVASVVEVHPQPVEASVIIEENKQENSTEGEKTTRVVKERTENTELQSVFAGHDVAVSSDREPLVDNERGGDDSDGDRKSRRKPFKLAGILRDMMKVRDELDHNQEKINNILKRTSSEERRESSVEKTDKNDASAKPKTVNGNGGVTVETSSKTAATFENANTLPVGKPLSTRKKRIGAMGKASGVGQLLRQIHTSGMKMAVSSEDDSPPLARKESRESQHTTPSKEHVKDCKATERDASSSDDEDEERYDSDDATAFLSMGQRSSGGMAGDVVFMSGMGNSSRGKYGGYGRNQFGFAMGPGMHHSGLRPGVHTGAMYHGRGGRMSMARKGHKYRARSSGGGRGGRRGGRGGMM